MFMLSSVCGIDEGHVVRVERSAERGQKGAERGREQLVADQVDAERLRGVLVLADGHQAVADRAALQPGGHRQHEQQETERHVIVMASCRRI